MIADRAETSMASLLREHLVRGGGDARVSLRQIFRTGPMTSIPPSPIS
jgi:hypothetical protein